MSTQTQTPATQEGRRQEAMASMNRVNAKHGRARSLTFDDLRVYVPGEAWKVRSSRSTSLRPIHHTVRREGELLQCSCEARAKCWHMDLVLAFEAAVAERLPQVYLLSTGVLARLMEQPQVCPVEEEALKIAWEVRQTEEAQARRERLNEDRPIVEDPDDGDPFSDPFEQPSVATFFDWCDFEQSFHLLHA